MFSRLLRRPPAPPSAAAVHDPAWWMTLHPAGRISPQACSLPQPTHVPPPPGDATPLQRDGHVTLRATWDAGTVAGVLGAAQAVFRAGWPATCALLFDEAWEALWQPRLRSSVGAQLGGEAMLVPLFHVHHVPAVEGASGWAPHVDYAEDLALPPQRLTGWMALADARVDNGCMHVVPPGVLPGLVARLPTLDVMSAADALTLLHHVRALPADAGDLVCWRPGVLHFGGVVGASATSARWALSTEWARRDAPPEPDRPAPLPPGFIPGFSARLELVANSLRVFADVSREPHAHVVDLLRQR